MSLCPAWGFQSKHEITRTTIDETRRAVQANLKGRSDPSARAEQSGKSFRPLDATNQITQITQFSDRYLNVSFGLPLKLENRTYFFSDQAPLSWFSILGISSLIYYKDVVELEGIMARATFVCLFVLMQCATAAHASPISYDFSGTFSAPVNGSTNFSGTFSYDPNLALNPNATQSATTAYYTDSPSGLINLDVSDKTTSAPIFDATLSITSYCGHFPLDFTGHYSILK